MGKETKKNIINPVISAKDKKVAKEICILSVFSSLCSIFFGIYFSNLTYFLIFIIIGLILGIYAKIKYPNYRAAKATFLFGLCVIVGLFIFRILFDILSDALAR